MYRTSERRQTGLPEFDMAYRLSMVERIEFAVLERGGERKVKTSVDTHAARSIEGHAMLAKRVGTKEPPYYPERLD